MKTIRNIARSQWCLLLAVLLAACERKEVDHAASKVPTKLFDVQLGKTYQVEDDRGGNLPVAKLTGVERALGHGSSFYFQPKKLYEAFPYQEKRKKPDDKYFGTTYRLYMLPVLPKSVKNISDAVISEHEVLLIEWSDFREAGDSEQQDQDYGWAQSMCKTFEADLGVKPTVNEQWRVPGDKTTLLGSFYSCTFSEADRELSVESTFGRKVSLKFTNEAVKNKEAAFDNAVRKLQAPSIRPY